MGYRSSAKVVGFLDVVLSTSLFVVAVILTTLPLWIQPPMVEGSSSKKPRGDEYYRYFPETDPSILECLLDSKRISKPFTWVVLTGAPALFTVIVVLAAVVLIQSLIQRHPDESLQMLRHWKYCSFFGLALCLVYMMTGVECLGPRFPWWPVPCLLLLIRGILILVVHQFKNELVYSNCSNPSRLIEKSCSERSKEAQVRAAELEAMRKLPYGEHKDKMREHMNLRPNCGYYEYRILQYRTMSNMSAGMWEADERVKRDFGRSKSSNRKEPCEGALLQCVVPCAGVSKSGGKRGRRMSDI